jgi:hypothetical protein
LYAGVEHAFYKPIGLAVADSEIEKVNLETWNILWDSIRWGITEDIKMVLADSSYQTKNIIKNYET